MVGLRQPHEVDREHLDRGLPRPAMPRHRHWRVLREGREHIIPLREGEPTRPLPEPGLARIHRSVTRARSRREHQVTFGLAVTCWAAPKVIPAAIMAR